MSESNHDLGDDETGLLELLDHLVEPAVPPTRLRAALLDSLSARPTFLGYTGRLSRIFDLSAESTQAALSLLGDRTRWVDVEGGGKFCPIAGGPRVQGAQVGFVEFGARSSFPRHRHQGLEVQFVITGRLIETEGREYWPGDVLVKQAGSEHAFSIGQEAACICAVVLYEGIEFA
jgi:quercetin dioxygenase-like cupin family protein